ncbi:MAG: RNA 2'-phosphotransferase [Thermoplasmata archaeon]
MSDLPPKYESLSRYLSYILRHDPGQAGIELDEKGFASIDDVLSAVDRTRHSWASIEDIEKLISESHKTRFEIQGATIRALYGHSVDVELEEECEPPSRLYHGTSPKKIDRIMRDGLKSMGRQYVHLSKTVDEAESVGVRHHPDPVVLLIDGKRAYNDGVRFFERGDIFLSENVPPEYISVLDR